MRWPSVMAATTAAPVRSSGRHSGLRRTSRPSPARAYPPTDACTCRGRRGPRQLLSQQRSASPVEQLAELCRGPATPWFRRWPPWPTRFAWPGAAKPWRWRASCPAKTGGCPEDCHFCAQSSRFDTPVLATPFLDTDQVLAAARQTAAVGATEFCIVLAVRGPDERTMQRLLDLVPLVQAATGLNVAVSAGILDRSQAERLAAGGVHRYNHNLETARSFFPEIVTTHTWDERYQTCLLVARSGMELCCGVLLGMGETDAHAWS